MRMRFKPYARPELSTWPAYAEQPKEWRGKWLDFFADNKKPLRLELGCGKGHFLAVLGELFPEYNHLGIDIKSEVLVVAKRTVEQQRDFSSIDNNNIAITSQNIAQIDEILSSEDVVDRIYINFCNPWYKSGHAKHRLTHPRLLIKYRTFLKNGGEIYFKTDDEQLFNDTLRYFDMCGFSVDWTTRDLHKEEPEWNIRTEHEAMYSKDGIKIKACIARMQAAVLDKNAISKMRNV